jgi:hypothetical protein
MGGSGVDGASLPLAETRLSTTRGRGRSRSSSFGWSLIVPRYKLSWSRVAKKGLHVTPHLRGRPRGVLVLPQGNARRPVTSGSWRHRFFRVSPASDTQAMSADGRRARSQQSQG